MEKGQEQILKMILEKASHEKAGEAKELVGGLVDMVKKGELNASHIAESAPKIMEMVKPEHLEEVKGMFEGFTKNFGK